MIPRIDPPAGLMALAARQAGVLSVEQVQGFGLSRAPTRRLVDGGGWQRVATGLYLTHGGEPGWTGSAWAGVLLGGPRSRLGGAAAAHLWGVLDPAPAEILVLVPHDRSVGSRPPLRFVRERDGVRDGRRHGDPPRIALPDALLDVSDELDATDVPALVLRGVQTGRTSVRAIRAAVDRRSRLRHRRLLLDLVADAQEGAETPLELRYLRDVERAHGLPRGRRQARARRARDVRDVLYEQYGLVVELDGQVGHTGLGRFKDMNRDNLAVLAGELTLRYGWVDVTGRPCEVAWQVAAVLLRLGWTGVLQRCPNCRAVPDAELWVS